MSNFNDKSSFSMASDNFMLDYKVVQVTLKEKFIGTGSKNLVDLESIINDYASKGYRLHTCSTASGGSSGLMGGERIQATLVFERCK